MPYSTGLLLLRFKRATALAALAAVAAGVIFPWLGAGSLINWDEAIYAQVAREFLATGDWVTPHWQYQPWFEKPPLLMWLTAAAYRIFGVSEFAARLVSAVSGVATVAMTWALAARLYSPAAGWLAAAILLTSFAFLRSARLGMTDALLTLSLCAALYAYAQVRDGHSRYWPLVAASCGVAVMVKSVAGLVVPCVVSLTLFVDPVARRTLWSSSVTISMAVFLAIVGPWHVAMLATHGWTFVDEYIGYHVIQRATHVLEGHDAPSYFYIMSLWNGFYPWLLMLPAALARALPEATHCRSRSRLLLVTVALIILGYSVARTKLSWYILPVYPVLTVLLAAPMLTAIRDGDRLFTASLGIAACVAALLAPWKIFAVAAAVSALTLAITSASMTRHCRPMTAALGAFLFTVAALGQLDPHHQAAWDEDNREPLYAARSSPVARLARRASGPPDDRAPLALLPAPPLQSPEAVFYSNRPVTELRHVWELGAHLQQRSFLHLIATSGTFADVANVYSADVRHSDEGLIYAIVRRGGMQTAASTPEERRRVPIRPCPPAQHHGRGPKPDSAGAARDSSVD